MNRAPFAAAASAMTAGRMGVDREAGAGSPSIASVLSRAAQLTSASNAVASR